MLCRALGGNFLLAVEHSEPQERIVAFERLQGVRCKHPVKGGVGAGIIVHQHINARFLRLAHTGEREGRSLQSGDLLKGIDEIVAPPPDIVPLIENIFNISKAVSVQHFLNARIFCHHFFGGRAIDVP